MGEQKYNSSEQYRSYRGGLMQYSVDLRYEPRHATETRMGLWSLHVRKPRRLDGVRNMHDRKTNTETWVGLWYLHVREQRPHVDVRTVRDRKTMGLLHVHNPQLARRRSVHHVRARAETRCTGKPPASWR